MINGFVRFLKIKVVLVFVVMVCSVIRDEFILVSVGGRVDLMFKCCSVWVYFILDLMIGIMFLVKIFLIEVLGVRLEGCVIRMVFFLFSEMI